MCAILDNDVVHEVFRQDRPAAGKAFFDWIDSGRLLPALAHIPAPKGTDRC